MSCLSPGCIIENNINYKDHSKGAMLAEVENQKASAESSFSRDSTFFWTYQPSTKLCWPKTSKAGILGMEGVVSGSNECGKDGKGRLSPQSWMIFQRQKYCPLFQYIIAFVSSMIIYSSLLNLSSSFLYLGKVENVSFCSLILVQYV